MGMASSTATAFRSPSRCSCPAPARRGCRSRSIVQEQWRQLGVEAEVVPLEIAQYLARRKPGDFDVAIESFTADPSPWSLLDRWGCGAEANYGRYCSRTADSLLRAAHLARRDPAPPIRAWLRTVAEDFPAAFLFAPGQGVRDAERVRQRDLAGGVAVADGLDVDPARRGPLR